MDWTKKWCEHTGRFEHNSSDGLISIFKDSNGFKYRFIPSVMAKDFSGYATSTHHWETLSGIKSYLDKNIHFMTIVSNDDEKDYGEYEITNGKIVNV